MDIGVPLRDLGHIDSGALIEAVLSADDQSWLDNSHRQSAYEVHHQTQSLMMLFVDTERWPQIEVSKQSAWERLSDTALPIMKSILKDFSILNFNYISS